MDPKQNPPAGNRQTNAPGGARLVLALAILGSAAAAQARPASPGGELTTSLQIQRASEAGLKLGVGAGLLGGGPQLLAISYMPFWSVRQMARGDTAPMFTVVALPYATALGVLTAGTGLVEVIAGAYLVHKNRLGAGAGPEVRRAWDIGLCKGLGYSLLAHGSLNTLVAGVLWKISDGDLSPMLGSRETSRAILGVALGLGVAQVVAGGALAISGHSRTAEVVRAVAVAPVILPHGTGVAASLRF